jgi:hypothetical protein
MGQTKSKILPLWHYPLKVQQERELRTMPREMPRNIGSFRINGHVLHHDFDMFLKITKDIAIVEARHDWSSQGILFTGVSEKYFSALPEGEVAPDYTWKLDRKGDVVWDTTFPSKDALKKEKGK